MCHEKIQLVIGRKEGKEGEREGRKKEKEGKKK